MKKLIDELIIARDNADSIKEAQAVQLCINIVKKYDSWISVKNELPPLREGLYADGIRSNTVLIRGFTAYAMGRYNYKKKNWERIDGEDISEVTDWMPIYEKGLL